MILLLLQKYKRESLEVSRYVGAPAVIKNRKIPSFCFNKEGFHWFMIHINEITNYQFRSRSWTPSPQLSSIKFFLPLHCSALLS